ncbi:MAG: ABC transporter permease [Deltaproteobacteria bacterium]|nr:ABC transporter permease [Deltaproteobacteria bacterium]
MRNYFLLLQGEAVKTWAFVFKNWVMTKRNVFTVFEILFWPVVSFLSVGLLAEFAALQPEMKAFVLIGVVAMSAVQVCQLDVAYGLLYDVWSKSLKHGFIAPAGIRHLVLGSMLMGVIRGGVVFLVLLVASYLFFGFDFTVPGPLALSLFILGLFLSGAMVGLFVCLLVLTLGNRAEVAAWSLVSLILLICGIYYPVTILPRWVVLAAELIPVTYFLEYFRQFYGFSPNFSHVLIKGYASVMIYLILEVMLMKAALTRAKKKGVLLRLSE